MISSAFRKYRKDCNILKIILLEGFCPVKTEIARFSILLYLSVSTGAVIGQFSVFYCTAPQNVKLFLLPKCF